MTGYSKDLHVEPVDTTLPGKIAFQKTEFSQ